MRLAILFLACIASVAAVSYQFTDGQNYTVEGNTYSINLYNSNAILLGQGNTHTLLRVNDCKELTYTEFCLKSAGATSATIEESFSGPVLKATHTFSSSTSQVYLEVTGVINLTNTGNSVNGVVVTIVAPPEIQLTGSNPRTESWLLSVYKQGAVTYTFQAVVNGTYNISANVTYFDGNATRVLSANSRAFSATVPFSYKVGYSNSSSGPYNFSVNLTNSGNQNFTYTIVADFPKQVEFGWVTPARAIVEPHRVSIADFLNSTHTTLNLSAIYSFSSPPTDDLTLYITYENSTDSNTIRQYYHFQKVEDPDPSLAVSVDPMVENMSGVLNVIITGNRTGKLSIAGEIFNATSQASSGPNEFVMTPSTPGNYTLTITFNSTSVYGVQSTAKGNITVAVVSAIQATEDAAQSLENLTFPPVNNSVNITSQPVAATGYTHNALVVGAAAALSLLVILCFIIIKFRNPLAKIEKQLNAISAAASKLESKRSHGLTKEEEAELKELQKRLQSLQDKL